MHINRCPEIVFSESGESELLKYLESNSLSRGFFITGSHVSKTPGFVKLIEALSKAGFVLKIFNRTSADPELELVDSIVSEVRKFQPDVIIGIGGGSPLDAAKAVAVLADNTWTAGQLFNPPAPLARKAKLILIPTTSGTGSEVTPISILTDKVNQIKQAVVDDCLIPDFALLVSELSESMPASVTAATGMDALCHAAEAYLSVKRTPYTDLMALEALRLIGSNLKDSFLYPDNIKARSGMLRASLYAGLAFSNASVTAVHAFAYPLGGMYKIPHGMANSIMFAPVFRHNLKGSEKRYGRMYQALTGGINTSSGSDQLVPFIQELQSKMEMPASLKEWGVEKSDIDSMAAKVMKITRLLSCNPVPVELEDALRIYSEAYE